MSDLTTLQYLNCDDNRLTILDVSGCADLSELYCFDNQLTSLDVSGCTSLVSLDCFDKQLMNLNVSGCTALEYLGCSDNQLTGLDVSGCTSLVYLACSDNQLTALDVSDLTTLQNLECSDNQLTALDVSSCTALRYLVCSYNRLTYLDMSSCSALTNLNCFGNQLTDLDVSGCTSLRFLNCSDNKLVGLDVSGCTTALTDLSCSDNRLASINLSKCRNLQNFSAPNDVCPVEVGESQEFDLTTLPCFDITKASKWIGGTVKDSILHFDYNQVVYDYATGSSHPKYDTLRFVLQAEFPLLIDSASFPDSIFRDYVSRNMDADNDGYLRFSERNCAREMDISGLGIHSLQGIEYFTDMESLDCSDNHLTSLDLSSNTRLRDLQADSNCLDVKVADEKCFDLRDLPGFDVPKVTDWQGGYVEDSILYFEEEIVTYTYRVNNDDFEDVIFMLHTEFPLLPVNESNFPDEPFRNYISDNIDTSSDGHLSHTELSAVIAMDISGLGIHSLQGIEHFTDLESLDCSDNHLTSLDLSANTRLRDLQADSNCLDVKVDDEKRFDLRDLPGFDMSKVSDWQGGHVEDSILYFEEEIVTYTYRVVNNGGFEGVVFMLRTDFPDPIPVNNETFPDEAFRAYVSENIDVSHDGNLSEGEINSVTTMDVSGLGIRSLQGMEYFTALESLDCSDNELTSLDLSANTKLQSLNAENNIYRDVVLDVNEAFNLSALPNFDNDRATEWSGAVPEGNTLTFTQQEATYQYATAYAGERGAESLKSVLFTLVADRDPSIEPDPDPDVANEDVNVSQGRVYAKDGTIFTEGLSGEVSVYTTVGTLLYKGYATEIPVPASGVYIVSHNSQSRKVFVL